jgi:hypothetical protein
MLFWGCTLAIRIAPLQTLSFIPFGFNALTEPLYRNSAPFTLMQTPNERHSNHPIISCTKLLNIRKPISLLFFRLRTLCRKGPHTKRSIFFVFMHLRTLAKMIRGVAMNEGDSPKQGMQSWTAAFAAADFHRANLRHSGFTLPNSLARKVMRPSTCLNFAFLGPSTPYNSSPPHVFNKLTVLTYRVIPFWKLAKDLRALLRIVVLA